jgi:hypothetical protein
VSDLDVIESPNVRTVDYRGERIEIRPLTIGQLPGFVRNAKPVLAEVFKDGEIELTPELLLDLVAEHGEALTAAAAVAVKRPVEWIAEGDPGEFVALVAAVIGVNVDFFAHRLAPQTAQALGSLSGAGLTRSKP